ncbi:hypothetical protein G6F23_013416 [Rhizopus arrhizus]|nr:hypothetical protein G6F23_013416 [Rhizopus arrhizus]
MGRDMQLPLAQDDQSLRGVKAHVGRAVGIQGKHTAVGQRGDAAFAHNRAKVRCPGPPRQAGRRRPAHAQRQRQGLQGLASAARRNTVQHCQPGLWFDLAELAPEHLHAVPRQPMQRAGVDPAATGCAVLRGRLIGAQADEPDTGFADDRLRHAAWRAPGIDR